MQHIEIPQFPVLRGEKAIKALYDFISELEEQRGEELSERQTDAMIKLAKGLISSIEAEKKETTSSKDLKKKHFVTFAQTPFLTSLTAYPHLYAMPKPI